MRLQGVFALFVLVGLAFARAADYELVLHGASGLKGEKTLAVYDGSNTLKQGDSIVKVTFSEGRGSGDLRIAPVKERKGMLLANKGHAFGYEGVIMLQSGKVPSGAASGSLQPYSPSTTMKGFKGNDKDMTLTEKFARWPWQWIILGLILVFVAAMFFTKGKSETVPGTPYAGRRGLEEAIRDIRARLEQIDANQKELVKKPPVLRSFRAQIDGFDQRLKKLEGTSVASQRSVLGVASSLAALKSQLTSVGDEVTKSESNIRSNNELVSRLGQEAAQHMAELDSRLRELQAAQHGLTNLPASLEALDAKIQALQGLLQTASALGKATSEKVGSLGDDLGKRAQALATSVDALGKGLVNALSDLEAIKAEVATESARAGSIEAGLKALAQHHSSFVERQDARAQAAHDDLETLKATAAFFAGEIGSLKGEQVEMLSILEPIRSQVTELSAADLKRLDGDIKALRDAESARSAHLSALQDSLNQKLAQLGAKMESLSEASGSNEAVEGMFEALRAQILALQSKQESIVINASSEDSALVSEQLKELLSAQNALKSLESSLSAVESRLAALPRLEAGMETLPKLQVQLEALPAIEARLGQLESRPESAPAPAHAPAESLPSGLSESIQSIEERSAANEASLTRLTELIARLGMEGEQARKSTEQRLAELLERVESIPAQQEAPKAAPVVIEAAKPEPVRSQPEPAPAQLIGSGTEQLDAILKRNADEASRRQAEAEAQGEHLPLTVLEAVRSLNHQPEVEDETPQPQVIHLEEIKHDDEEHDHEHDEEHHAASAGMGWPCVGGSVEQRWSSHLSKGFPLKKAEEIKALMPIETPDISSPVTQMIYTSGQVVYSHGKALRGFWPGRESRSASLSAQLPDDPWRVLSIGGSIYCAGEEAVDVVGLPQWSNSCTFDGRYLNQLQMGKYWAGVRAAGGSLAIDVRTDMGEPVGTPFKLSAGADERTLLAGFAEDLFVAAESGALFKLNLTGMHALGSVKGHATHLAYHRGELIVLWSKGRESQLSILDASGKVLRQTAIPEVESGSNVVVMGERLYALDKDGNVHTVNLKKAQVASSRPLKGIKQVRQMMGMHSGKDHYLLLATRDGSSHAGRVLLLDTKTGEETKLCSVNQPGLEVVWADGRAVVATSCSFQNIIRIFEPFAFAKQHGKAA